MKQPWYVDSFGSEYLELYAHRNVDLAQKSIQAIVWLLDPPQDKPLLDLCCGAGRHLVALREMGFSKLVGLDLSTELLHAAGITLDEPGIPLVQADMRAIPFHNQFTTILSLFTSFGYFVPDEENQAVFETVYRALEPGGSFLIDYMNRDYVIANLVARDEKTSPDRHIRNVRRLTPDGKRVEKTTTITTTAGKTREFHESVRLYNPAKMHNMLSAAGLTNIQSYGSIMGGEFTPSSTRLIMTAKKGTV